MAELRERTPRPRRTPRIVKSPRRIRRRHSVSGSPTGGYRYNSDLSLSESDLSSSNSTPHFGRIIIYDALPSLLSQVSDDSWNSNDSDDFDDFDGLSSRASNASPSSILPRFPGRRTNVNGVDNHRDIRDMLPEGSYMPPGRYPYPVEEVDQTGGYPIHDEIHGPSRQYSSYRSDITDEPRPGLSSYASLSSPRPRRGSLPIPVTGFQSQEDMYERRFLYTMQHQFDDFRHMYPQDWDTPSSSGDEDVPTLAPLPLAHSRPLHEYLMNETQSSASDLATEEVAAPSRAPEPTATLLPIVEESSALAPTVTNNPTVTPSATTSGFPQRIISRSGNGRDIGPMDASAHRRSRSIGYIHPDIHGGVIQQNWRPPVQTLPPGAPPQDYVPEVPRGYDSPNNQEKVIQRDWSKPMEEPPPVAQQGRTRRASTGYIHPDIQRGPIRMESRNTLSSEMRIGLANNRSSTGSTSNQDVDSSPRPNDTALLQPSVMNPRTPATASHNFSNQVRNERTARERMPAEEHVKQTILPFVSALPNDIDPQKRCLVTRQISRLSEYPSPPPSTNMESIYSAAGPVPQDSSTSTSVPPSLPSTAATTYISRSAALDALVRQSALSKVKMRAANITNRQQQHPNSLSPCFKSSNAHSTNSNPSNSSMNPLKRSADGAPSVPPPPSKSPAISVSAHRPHATAAVANPRATTRFRQPHIASGSELTAAAVVSQSRLEQLPTPRPVLGLHKYGGVIDPAPRAASGFSISADVDGSVMANAPTTITTNAAVGFVSTNPPATVTTPTPAVIKHSIQPGEEAATAAQERAEDIQYDENDDPNDSDDSDDSDDEGGPGHNASSSSFGMGHTITTTSSYTHHGGNLPLLSGSDDEDMTDPSIFLDTDPNDVDYDDNDEDDDDDDDGYLGDLDLEPEPEMSLEEERALMEEWFRENNIDNNK